VLEGKISEFEIVLTRNFSNNFFVEYKKTARKKFMLLRKREEINHV